MLNPEEDYAKEQHQTIQQLQEELNLIETQLSKQIRIQTRKISKLQLNVEEFKLLLLQIQCNSDLNDDIIKAIEVFNERWNAYDVIHSP